MTGERLEGQRGLITAGLMVAMFMGTLDQTVVNVSLSHMQGNLSATQDQVTWVVTSYMVASAITMPISGWLASRFGLKAMLLTALALFTFTSILCGLAVSMPQMVFLRFAQGTAFAPIVPLIQVVFLRIYPPERMGRAMAMFTTAGIMGPVIGPVLGGWITDNLSWRWCFFINLPAGAVAFFLLWAFLPKEAVAPRRFDFLGFISLAVAIAAFQLAMDRGPSHDWLGSPEIATELVLAAIGLWVYVTHTLTAAHPLIDPAVTKDRNFVVGTGLQFVFTMLFYCSVALLPLIVQNLMNYPAEMAGFLNFPRSILVLGILQIIGRIDRHVDRRLLAAFGMGVFGVSCWIMSGYDLSMAPETVISATLIQGLGQACANVPLSTLSFMTLGAALRTDASTISNLLRNVAGSVGISLMQWFMVLNGQSVHAAMTEHVSADNTVMRAYLPAYMSPNTVQGAVALNSEITRQSTMAAFVGNFRLMFVVAMLCVPAMALLRNSANAATRASSRPAWVRPTGRA